MMGHAGALVFGKHGSFASKRAALEGGGVEVFSTLADIERVLHETCKVQESIA